MKQMIGMAALLVSSCLMQSMAQDMSYKEPPKEIKEIALAKMPPSVLVS